MSAATVSEAVALADHEELLQLLYSVPVGLVHARLDGTIHLINSAAARWLLPLSPDGRLDNLFDALSLAAPGLRGQAATATRNRPVIEDELRLSVSAGSQAPPHHVAMRLTRFGDDRLRIGPVKLFADGSIGGRTARMRRPYEGQPDNVGLWMLPPEELKAKVRRAHEAGFQVGIHAIGDAAVELVVDAYA